MRTGLREARKYLLILNFNNMGKLYDRLQKQLKSEEYKKDAEDCLKIYEKLKEMNNGSVWESSWNPLTTVKFVGTYPNSERIYKPSKEGYVFLKGIEEKKEREAGVRYISENSGLKIIYLDIMVKDRFVTQIPYPHCTLFPIDSEELKNFVLEKRPSLKNKDFRIEFSNNKVK